MFYCPCWVIAVVCAGPPTENVNKRKLQEKCAPAACAVPGGPRWPVHGWRAPRSCRAAAWPPLPAQQHPSHTCSLGVRTAHHPPAGGAKGEANVQRYPLSHSVHGGGIQPHGGEIMKSLILCALWDRVQRLHEVHASPATSVLPCWFSLRYTAQLMDRAPSKWTARK